MLDRLSRQDAPRRRQSRVRWAARLALLACTALVGMSAAEGASESRRELGDRYARAFSDGARSRIVTWDDRSCTFNETAPDLGRSDLPATSMIAIPIAQTTFVVHGRAARTGTLEVLFRCEPTYPFCMTRLRRYGSTVIATERLTEHTLALAGSIADTARVTQELDVLRNACLRRSDAGPS